MDIFRLKMSHLKLNNWNLEESSFVSYGIWIAIFQYITMIEMIIMLYLAMMINILLPLNALEIVSMIAFNAAMAPFTNKD